MAKPEPGPTTGPATRLVMATLPYDKVFVGEQEGRAMNVEAQVTWTDGERFVANASSGHAIVIDSDRQRNTAAGPMEMVLMGLCACTATDVVSILRKKREPFVGVHVKAEAVRADRIAHGLYFDQTYLYGFRAGFTQGGGRRGQAV